MKIRIGFAQKVLALLVLLLFITSGGLFAQAGRGSISGTITDSSGAIIAGAEVVLLNKATGVTLHTTSSSGGVYTFVSLNPGVYQVTASQTGFAKTVRDKVTVDVNDVLLANELQYRVGAPRDGQIAVFKPPPQVPELGDTDFIKRVIAGPGDQLRIHNGVVYRNGQALVEPYIMQRPDYELELRDYDLVVDGIPLDPTRAVVPPKSAWQAPDRVPKGYYVMLGDNRNNSDDSHLWGFLAQDQFVGHAFLVFWPVTRAKLLH